MRDSGSSVQVQSSEPWEPQGDRLQHAFKEADSLFGAGKDGLSGGQRSYYPGATYVPFAGETESALGMTADRARQGSAVQRGGNQLAADTLGGKFTSQGNPYLDQVYGRGARSVTDQFTKSVIPSINSTFSTAGRFGSDAHKEMTNQATDTLGRSLSEMYADMAMPTYEAERGRQMQTMGMAPSLAAADYQDADRLASVGATREGLYEQQLADDMNRFHFNQDEPYNATARYMQMLGGNFGGTSAATTPIYRNRGAGMLGGAAAGSAFGPWGALLGAGLGAM